MTPAARKSGGEAWLRILRRRHPGITFTLRRPRLERDSAATLRQTGRSLSPPDEQHPVGGRAA